LHGGDASFPSFTLNGGALQGTGTVSVAGTLTSSGTVAPGLSAGTLNLAGNYTQTAAGTLDVELAGRNTGEFDVLAVTGTASLNGTLRVTVHPQFLPGAGEQFQILTCASRSGVFSVTNVPAGLVVSYASNGVFLVVTGQIAPTLSVARTATNTIVISWPWPAEGWVLQATNALPTVSAPWPQIPPPYQTNAGVISVTVTNVPPTGSQFYRLHKP